MKLKNIRRMIACLLVVVILMASPVCAIENRASAYLDAYRATITKTSTGEWSINFLVDAVLKMTDVGASSIEVQRKVGSFWITEYTYLASEYPELMGHNRSVYAYTFCHDPLVDSADYRAVVTVYAGDDTGFDTGVYTATTY